MEADEITVNDGGGLFDSTGLINTLIVDINRSMKALIGGSYVEFAVIQVGMVQKLGELEKGIKNDMEGLKRQIAELRAAEGGEPDAAGCVYYPLDGAVGGREERLRDAYPAESGGLE